MLLSNAQTTTEGEKRLILLACVLATFTAAIESTIIASSMPSIVRTLGGTELYTWAFSAYLISQAVTIPIYGRLADIMGRKRIFLAGSALFALGTALCSCSGGMLALVLSRAIQGCGAGAVQPIAYTIVADIYTPIKRARIQGLLSGVFGLAAGAGPFLGPFMTQYLGWQSIFWTNLPIVTLAAAIIAFCLREEKRKARQPVDIIGATLLSFGLTAALLAADQWNHFGVLGLTVALCAAAVTLGCLWRHQKHTPQPIIPRDLLANNVVRLGSLGALSTGFCIMTLIPFLPLFVSQGLGWTLGKTGPVICGLVVVWTFGSVFAGQLLAFVSYKRVGLVGAALIAAGSILLTLTSHDSTVYRLSIGILFIGIGLGFCNTTFLIAVQTSVAFQRRASATSTVLFLRFLGQALGAALGGIVISTGLRLLFPGSPDLFGALFQGHDTSQLAEVKQTEAFFWMMKSSFMLTLVASVAAFLICVRLPGKLTAKAQTQSAALEAVTQES
jgi:MFS family permease